MKMWVIVFAVLCARESLGTDCAAVSTDLAAVPPVLAGLDSALALPAAALCLSPSAVPFTVSTTAAVSSQVTIQGGGQTIIFLKSIDVKGSLVIFNSTLTTSVTSVGFSMLNLIKGSVQVENSSVKAASAPFLSGSGSVALNSTAFTSNTAPAVSIDYKGEMTVEIRQCDVWNHTGQFIRISSLVNSGEIFVLIEQTTFRENEGTGFLLSYTAPLLTGNFTISNSKFTSNRIPLLYFDIGKVRTSIVKSTYTDNTQTTLTLYAAESEFAMTDSQWTGNFQIVFDIRQFTGNLQITGITVKKQQRKGIFQIANNLSPEECRFSMSDSTFLDTYFKVNEPTPGILEVSGCMIEISRTLINNVRMAAVHQRDLGGLLLLRFGNVVVSQLTLRSSGCVGFGLAVAMGNFTITDSLLYDVQSGSRVYVGDTLGSLILHNVNFTHGIGFPLDEENMGTVTVYASVYNSYMELRNVRVLSGPEYDDECFVMYATFSTLNISGIVVEGQHMDTIGHFIDVKGTISNVTICNCLLDTSVLYFNNVEFVRVSGLNISDSAVGVKFKSGVIASSPRLNIACIDLTVSHVSAYYLVASKQAQVRLSNITVSNSSIDYFLKYQVDSTIYIEDMKVYRSIAILAFLYRSSLRIVNSSFERFNSSSIIIGGEDVNITIDGVVMKDVFSPLGFSNFREKCNLTITRSKFEHYQSSADEAFIHDTGTLSITNSTFSSFNTVFIQASNCLVYIENSVFQEGRSKALSRASASAYGGALACIDCPIVVVESSAFLNASAIFGGAIAVRSASALLSLRISNCEFVMCSATAGGAVYVEQSSLLVEKSKFIGNEATSTGGAVDVYTSQERKTIIRSCAFYRNRATEGGAVKWSDAEVSFINVTFQDNAAAYGPDIASYGVKVSGSVAASNGTEASGYPLQLVFELQDHYGQRVTTASARDFQLRSSSQVTFRGNSVAAIDHGVFNFSQLTVYARPNSTQQVSGAMVTTQNQEVGAINASVDIAFRDCVSGEVRKADRCEYCVSGNVSFAPSDSDCSYCPKHAFCPGGDALIVDPSYWRSSTLVLDLVRCPLRSNCLGGQHSECARGYTGKVCNECFEAYTRYRTLECESCGSRVLQSLKLFLIAVPVVGFNMAVRTASDNQLFILKSFINHAQLLSALSYIRISHPTVIKHSLHSLSYFSSLFITDLPISCFYIKHPEYIKAVIGSATPLAFYLSLVLFNRNNKARARVACTSAMMFTPLISLATQIPLLACQPVEGEERYLFVDMQEKCWEGQHLLLARALLAPSAILNVLLPVVLVAATAIIRPKKFDESFSLWRSGVKLRCWDLLIYCSKGMLTCFLVVSISANQLSQVAYGLMVLIVVSTIAAGFSRYAYIHWKWFFLTEFSLVIVAVSMGLSAYFIYHSPAEGVTIWLITAVLLVLNVGYFAACAVLWRFPLKLTEEATSPCVIAVPPNSMADFSLCSQELH